MIRLTPKDPAVDFKKLIADYELSPQAYVVLDDYHFTGKVGRAQSPDETLGSHLAMFEVQGADRPDDPALHEFFRAGSYRGPYADVPGERPPWAFVSKPGFEHEIGELVDLRLPASSRGEPFVRLNRAGGAESPPWDFLLGSTELVLQHTTDPALDIVVPVTATLDGWRVRYTPADPKWADFRQVAKMAGYRPLPFVRVHDFDFAAEVHGDTRLSTDYAGRRALVPVHPIGEPQGPYGDTLPYAPHPAELVGAGMHGPVLARDGTARIAQRASAVLPGWAVSLTAVAALLLAIASLAGWFARTAEGTNLAKPVLVLLLAAIAVSAALTWTQAVSIAALATAFAVAVSAAAIVLGFVKIRSYRE
jgi:hypothetical protein